MAIAWLLTILALGGVAAGVRWGHSVQFSHHLSAAGGGLLFGISLFWLIPEVSLDIGRLPAIFMTALVTGILATLDRVLTHGGHLSKRGFVWPILLATAIHSFLDGWSVRLLSIQPLTQSTVTIGLALHKIPEGLALGWITRRTLSSMPRAFLIAGAAELFTLAGAFFEPALNSSGSEHFGLWWPAAMLSVIAGGFLFLGLHAILPVWRRRRVMATFVATLLTIGALTVFRTGNI